MHPLVQVRANVTVINSGPGGDAAVAAEFAQRHALVIPDFIEPRLLAMVSSLWTSAQFVQSEIPELGFRAAETPGRAGEALGLALGRPPLPAWLEKVTGCGPLGKMLGYVAQYHAGADHFLDWHNDTPRKGRNLGITVNLGSQPYEGGCFEMKKRGSDELLLKYVHSQPGSALIFRVAKGFVHRVTPVSSGGPRTVFSGWYYAKEDTPHA